MSLATLLIANYHTNQITFQYVNSQVKYNLKEETNLIVSKASSMKSKNGQRNKLSSEYGRWFLNKADDSVVYAVCVQEEYPERLAYGAIQKIRTFVKEKSVDAASSKKMPFYSKELKNMCVKYKDSKADKVKEAQGAVEELKDELNKGIKKVFDNHENLDKLSDRTRNIKDFAKQFQKSAVVVQKQAFMKKWKIYFVLGFIIAAILIVSGLTIYMRHHQ